MLRSDSPPVEVKTDLSVIIVSYNTRDLLARCLDTLLEAADRAGIALDTIVVDNCSRDGSIEMLGDRYPGVRLIQSTTNSGFAAANNLGMRQARAGTILLLNSDAFVSEETLRRGLELLDAQRHVGMAGVRLLNVDGTLQAEWGTFPTLMSDIRTSVGFDQLTKLEPSSCAYVGPADWVQGACMFVRADALGEVGGLDETFFMYSEEVDWCRRFWVNGWEVWYLGDTSVVHLGGASSQNDDIRRRSALYRSKLGLRRRLGGPLSSATLWCCMLLGLGGRIAVRTIIQAVSRRSLGRQSPGADWALARRIAAMDPLARWAHAGSGQALPVDAR